MLRFTIQYPISMMGAIILDLITFVKREELVATIFTFISIIAAFVAVHYTERWRHKHGAGQDFEYGLHLLQVLADHGEESRRTNFSYLHWMRIERKTTERINASTVDGNYSLKKSNHRHHRQLREACHRLHEHGAVHNIRNGQVALYGADRDHAAQPDGGAIRYYGWAISGIGSKVLHRTLQRNSHDERNALFQLYYQKGQIPSAIAGEERSHQHQEYLERLLPDQLGVGDSLVRADDVPTMGFLIRTSTAIDVTDDSTGHVEFRYVEVAETLDARVLRHAPAIRTAVDIAWPVIDFDSSQRSATSIIAKRYGISFRDFQAVAWEKTRNDIHKAWNSNRAAVPEGPPSGEPQPVVDRARRALHEAYGIFEGAGYALESSSFERTLSLLRNQFTPYALEEIDRLVEKIERHKVGVERDADNTPDSPNAGLYRNLFRSVQELREKVETLSRNVFKFGRFQRTLDLDEIVLTAWIALVPDWASDLGVENNALTDESHGN